MERKIYLDTHIIVWLYDGEIEKLSEKAVEMIEENNLLISEFVRLELQFLFEIKRLVIEPCEIIEYLNKKIQLELCDLPVKSIINEAINYRWTRDPFDRLITANASVNNCILVTKDKTILDNYHFSLF